MRLSEFFQSTENTAGTHTWALVTHDSTNVPIDDLAMALADQIMKHRCRGCPQHYQSWKQHIEGGPPPTGASADALKAFIEPVFGLPEHPDAVPHDHMEGCVAEYLWYFLSLEGLTGGNVIRVEPPSFVPSDRGGDGLVIHRILDYLMFRLWEIKKCTGNSAVSSTVSNAYRQLDARAAEYLARYTAIGQELPDAALAEFYGKLIDLWVDAQPEAAAGISVAISLDHVPQRCFTTFGERFPRFVDPVRLRGMLTAIEDFSAFTDKVREYIWTGL